MNTLRCVVDNTPSQEQDTLKGFDTHDAALLAVVREVGPVECAGVVDVHIVERIGKFFPVLRPKNAQDINTLMPLGFAVI